MLFLKDNMIINNDIVKGFASADKIIRIFDKDKKPFYFFNSVKPLTSFNLPKGTYYSDNNIKVLKEPVKYKITMPKFERNIKRPKVIVWTWGNNPNKATIVLEKGFVLLDNSWKNFPPFVVTYIKYHELGHYHFKSEIGADAYARCMMLKRGYNPSQIGMASRLSLSPKSSHRIEACYHALKKTEL